MSYADLTKVSFEYAITEMINLTLRDGEEQKVLVVPIRLSANDWGKDISVIESFSIVAYKPHNYCFVGLIEDSHLTEESKVHFETYHDSCWRDGINRMISSVALSVENEMEEKGATEISVHTSFDIISPHLQDGYFILDKTERTAIFKPQII